MITAVVDLGDTAEQVATLCPEGLSHGNGDRRSAVVAIGRELRDHTLRNTTVVPVIMVKGQLVSDPQANDDGDGHAGGQAGYIDRRIPFVLQQVAPGKAEIIFEHKTHDPKIMPD